MSVQVNSSQTTPVVSIGNAIGVEHRNDLDHNLAAKGSGCGAGTEEEVENTLHRPRTVDLSWVNSCGQEHNLEKQIDSEGRSYIERVSQEPDRRCIV